MWGVRFGGLKNPMKTKVFGLTETKLFRFHRIFKLEGGGGEGAERGIQATF